MRKNQPKGHKIKEVLPGSIAQELELTAGDILLKINNEELEDIFDYQFLIQDEYLEILIEKSFGEIWELEIEKDMEEDLGLIFESDLMDEYRSCRNKCIFCFIDQMPKGMRETLYFKDDDSRLSFLQGNYITLTNMSDKDIDRIIRFHLAPINISFHTTNPKLRCEMLHNRFAGEALKKAERLFDSGIEMNGQIVLCKGVNDGEELRRSIEDLGKYIPCLKSVSVVPVGLTKFRDDLYSLEPFGKEDAKEVLSMIHKAQDTFMERCHTHFVHASDEWYLLAEEELPEEERYDGYLQLENGVGMLRLFINQVREAFSKREADEKHRVVSVATGLLAAQTLEILCQEGKEKFPNLKVHIYPIRNDFFGENITVSGLVTGQDILAQLKDKPLGNRLLLPCNMLRSGERYFLDDIQVSEIEETLQVPVYITAQPGEDFVKGLLEP